MTGPLPKSGQCWLHQAAHRHAAGTAAPIFNIHGNVIAAISISGPAQRFDKAKMKEMSQLLLKETRTISQELGYYAR